ncbi:hypothetical protein, partial [Zavarzinella formosa]|uniref:hypothetical protein n=1 Tax=Zavarzinella formosa TaxID=360055 RepID=UPI00138B08B9
MKKKTDDLFDILADLGGPIPSEDARDRRRREKGLPDEAARRDLALTYLTVQRRLWPALGKT